MSDLGSMTCCLCGANLGDKQWVALNRYAVGTGRGSLFTEGVNEDGECVWETPEDPGEAATASGELLCLEPCLMTWLQGKLIETNHELDILDAEDPT